MVRGMAEKVKFAQIVIGLPIDEIFTYSVPSHLKEKIKIGMRVYVPFGNRKMTGYVVDFIDFSKRKDIKEILSVLDERPVFDKDMLKLTKWVSDYYFCPWGEVVKAALPKGMDVKSYEFVMLSEQGRESLKKRIQKKKVEKKILDILSEVKGLKTNQLIKRTGIKNIHPYLSSLSEKGLIYTEKREEKSIEVLKKESFVRLCSQIKNKDIKDIIEKLCPHAPSQIKLLEFLLKRGEVRTKEIKEGFKSSSSIIKALEKKALIEVYDKVLDFISVIEEKPPVEEFLKLNSHQEKALKTIIKSIDSKKFSPFLLHGITGSGKTEVYLQAISYALNQGRNALFLVPEISLTPQLVTRFKNRFGHGIALLHSGLSRRERMREWEKVRVKKASIVIGTRSAVFAPIKNLGVIVVDEEHDSSYKQEENPRYNGRDVALMRAKYDKITIVLGSATPSFESFYNSRINKYHYLHLPERAEERLLPEVEIVDMRTFTDEIKKTGSLSPVLEKAIKERLLKKEQVLLFLNRRGFANFVMCKECGYVFKCLNCSVSLTYHSFKKQGRCHYCDFSAKIPDVCPQCQGAKIDSFGMGTQKVEDELKRLFEGVSIARMDRDTTRRRDAHEVIFNRIRNRDIDILIGTQMITKGHDFPNITLVGVISADGSLNIPNFRSSEKTFQLLSQVAGRTGRGELKGKVIIQTLSPEHYSITNAKSHDYINFYEKEISFRKILKYPPFTKLAVIKIEGYKEEKVLETINRIEKIFKGLVKGEEDVDILGPSRGIPPKIKNKHRCLILLKGKTVSYLHNTIRKGMMRFRRFDKTARGITISIDIDPITIF